MQCEEFKYKQTMLTKFNNYSLKSRLTGAVFVTSSRLLADIFCVYIPYLNTNDTNKFEEFEPVMQTPDAVKGLYTFQEFS